MQGLKPQINKFAIVNSQFTAYHFSFRKFWLKEKNFLFLRNPRSQPLPVVRNFGLTTIVLLKIKDKIKGSIALHSFRGLRN